MIQKKFNLLQSDITVNYAPHKYLLNFPMAHLTAASYPTKICIDFSVVKPLISRWKKFIVDKFLPGTCQIHTSHRPFLVTLIFFSTKSSACIITAPILSLEHYVLMWNLQYGSGLAKVFPGTMSLFSRFINFWSSGVHSFWTSYISSPWDIVPIWSFFDNIYLQGLISRSYKGKNWLKNPKIPTRKRRSPHAFGRSSLETSSFLDCVGCVTPAATSVPKHLHLYWNHFHF